MVRPESPRSIDHSLVESGSVDVRFTQADLDALDRWIAQQHDPAPTRPEVIRTALRAWLAGQGCLRDTHDHPEPVGPATDAIQRMEADIAHDRAKRKRKRVGL